MEEVAPVTCAFCNKKISRSAQKSHLVTIKGHDKFFCSEQCAWAYLHKNGG